jgi:hypothetical protein
MLVTVFIDQWFVLARAGYFVHPSTKSAMQPRDNHNEAHSVQH